VRVAYNLKEWKILIKKIVEELKKRAKEYYGERLISLAIFGSVAKGLATPSSDIDFLITLKSLYPSNFEVYREYYEKVESKLSSLREGKKKGFYILLSPIFKSPESLTPELPWLWRNEFIILHDTNDFFKNFLKKLKKFEREKPNLSFFSSSLL